MLLFPATCRVKSHVFPSANNGLGWYLGVSHNSLGLDAPLLRGWTYALIRLKTALPAPRVYRHIFGPSLPYDLYISDPMPYAPMVTA